MEKKAVGSAARVAILALASVFFGAGCSEALIGAVNADVEKALANDPPSGSVIINAGAGYAIDPNVSLTISATGIGGGTVIQMEIRNDLAWTGNWQSYATTLPWSLAAGEGSKDVYIRFKDDAENISSAFSDSIILDTVNPSISSYTPTSNAANQARLVAPVINFSEAMDASTITSTSVYLWKRPSFSETVPSVAYAIPATITKNPLVNPTSITITPSASLEYGMDYRIVVTNGAKDRSGRSISNPMNLTYFTVERDIWEGSGNESPATAYEFYSQIPSIGDDLIWDLVSNEVWEQGWSSPIAAHSTLAQLEGVDYYRIILPSDSYKMRVRVLLTNDEAAGTTPYTGGSENIILYVTAPVLGGPIPIEIPITNLSYDKQYEYDISALAGEDAVILVYENSGLYSNQRKYNISFWFHYDGI